MTQSPRTGSSAPSGTDVERPIEAPSSAPTNGHRPDGPPPGWSPSTTHGNGGRTATFPSQGQPGQPAPAGAPSNGYPADYRSGQPLPSATSRPANGRASRRGPRRAQLQLRHINPWTVLKFSCVLSIALFFVWLIVVGVLYGILDGAGIIGRINDTVTTINGPGSSPPVTAGVVFGSASIIGVINIVLFIALSTVGALVYNLCSDLVGGIEVTLSER